MTGREVRGAREVLEVVDHHQHDGVVVAHLGEERDGLLEELALDAGRGHGGAVDGGEFGDVVQHGLLLHLDGGLEQQRLEQACEGRFGRMLGSFPPGMAHRLLLRAPAAAIE